MTPWATRWSKVSYSMVLMASGSLVARTKLTVLMTDHSRAPWAVPSFSSARAMGMLRGAGALAAAGGGGGASMGAGAGAGANMASGGGGALRTVSGAKDGAGLSVMATGGGAGRGARSGKKEMPLTPKSP